MKEYVVCYAEVIDTKVKLPDEAIPLSYVPKLITRDDKTYVVYLMAIEKYLEAVESGLKSGEGD